MGAGRKHTFIKSKRMENRLMDMAYGLWNIHLRIA